MLSGTSSWSKVLGTSEQGVCQLDNPCSHVPSCIVDRCHVRHFISFNCWCAWYTLINWYIYICLAGATREDWWNDRPDREIHDLEFPEGCVQFNLFRSTFSRMCSTLIPFWPSTYSRCHSAVTRRPEHVKHVGVSGRRAARWAGGPIDPSGQRADFGLELKRWIWKEKGTLSWKGNRFRDLEVQREVYTYFN